jgi:hypothetical protein
VTTKYLSKFQNPRAITRPKTIGTERNVSLICNISLYTHIPNIKSISQIIVWILAEFWTLKFGQIFGCHFISLWFEILTWYLVCGCIMISYRSSLRFVPFQWFLAELWPLDFEIWTNIWLSLGHNSAKNHWNGTKRKLDL